MDAKLKKYLNSKKYLPEFMRDFHDQKLLFRRIDEINQNSNNVYTNDISWIAAQVYTIDIFLWYMATHGYILQKSRKKLISIIYILI